MKKSLKKLLSLVVAFVCVFGLTACKKPISATTTDVSKTVYNGQATNGGVTIVHDGYLYFINGTKTNDGKSPTKNVMSAVCRVKIDAEGKIDENSYEVVVDNLVGYDNGSIAIFGDFLYFATPNDKVNYQDVSLNYQTRFMRYDLVNKKSYVLYTTEKNSSSETISYEYYVVGEELHLVVYEKTAATIKSFKIGTEVKQNYKISNVSSCVLSENNGKCEIAGETVDANKFVFYTMSTDVYEDGISGGTIVYKTSPNENDASQIYKGSSAVTLLSIKNGKLIYTGKSVNEETSIIYYQSITASKTEELDFSYRISYQTYENIVFFGNDDGSVSALCMNSEDIILLLETNKDNPYEIETTPMYELSFSSSSSSSSSGSSDTKDISFIGVETVTIKEKDENEVETESKVTYLFYVKEKAVYKLEIFRDGNLVEDTEQVKLSKSTASAISGNMVPEVIGDYIYFFAKEIDEKEKDTSNIYLHRADVTVEDDSDKFGTLVAKTK